MEHFNQGDPAVPGTAGAPLRSGTDSAMGKGLPMVIVLAAGRGERFSASGGGVHKLQAKLLGKPVLQHTLEVVHASGLPLHVVEPDPKGVGGMADSIARGVRATPRQSGWLVLPADLPLVQAATLVQVAKALQNAKVVVPHCEGVRGHPVGFAAACGPELQTLSGEAGASSLVKKYGAHLLEVNDPGIHHDIDTVQDLLLAETLLRERFGLAGGADTEPPSIPQA